MYKDFLKKVSKLFKNEEQRTEIAIFNLKMC